MNHQSTTSVLSFNTIFPKDFIVSPEVDSLIDQNWKQACAAPNGQNYQQFLENHHKQYKPLVVVGPSGAGKGTLIDGIKAKYMDRFGFSVSFTTRKPREGEVHGKHYFFVTREEFEAMIGKQEFIEYCEVHTNYYGTAKSQIQQIQDSKRIPLLDIDVQGAYKFTKAFSESVVVAIVPPNVEALRSRLIARGTETEKSLETRLKNAPEELSEIFKRPEFFTMRIVNEDLALSRSTFEVLLESVYSREGLRQPKPLGFYGTYRSSIIGLGLLVGFVAAHEILRRRK